MPQLVRYYRDCLFSVLNDYMLELSFMFMSYCAILSYYPLTFASLEYLQVTVIFLNVYDKTQTYMVLERLSIMLEYLLLLYLHKNAQKNYNNKLIYVNQIFQ